MAIALTFLAVLLICVPAFAQKLSDIAPLPASQVHSQAITKTQTVTLHGHVHPLAQAQFDQGAVADSTPAEHVMLLLQRTPAQEAAAAAVVDALHNPNSPMYHQWLTPEQFGQHFGPSDSDMLALTNWLQQQGFKVEDVPPGRTHVTFSGTAGQMKAAFGAEFHKLSVNGEKHIAVLKDPTIPAALAPIVAGFRNLHDWSPKPNKVGQKVMKKNAKTGAWEKIMGPASVPEITFNYSGYMNYDVTPQDWFTIYNSNPLYQAGITGAGVTIAVIEETGLKSYSSTTGRVGDVDSFRSAFGLPTYPAPANATAGGINYINGPGNGCTAAASPTSTGEEGEALLDVEWAGAIAPNAIVDYVACNTTTNAIGTYGTDLAATYIANYLASTVSATSLSYGECEISAGTSGKTFYTNIWQQLSAEGITPVVSSGDAGSVSCDQNSTVPATHNLSTSTMSSTAYNISAGGTDFSDFYQAPTTGYSTYWSSTNGSTFGSALSYIPEISWGAYCSSPLFTSYLQYLGNTNFGTNYTPEYVCASTNATSYRTVVGGGGGISQYNTIPTWQSVYGIGTGTTSTTYRNEPDISFFAASGWWSHALSFCQSDSGYACTYSNGQDAYYLAAGGTSFVAPQINGLMALINQKWGRQGQANYTLYKLASQQYGTPGSPSATIANCSGSALGKNIPSTCIFHDVANDTPCINGISATMCTTANGALTAGTIASDIVESCRYSSVTNCYRASSSHSYGLTAVGSHTSTLAYRTAQGYDLATGLGSVNVANLVNNWNNVAGSFTTTTTLAASATNLVNQTDTTTLTATVTATKRGGVPGGSVTYYIGSTSGTSLGSAPLVANACTGTAPSMVCTASAALTVAASSLQGGSNSIIAYFGGDGANDAPSTSSAVTVTAPASTPAVIASPASGSTLTGTSVTFSFTSNGASAPYYFWIGTTPGGMDLINDQLTDLTSTHTVTLPANGATVYVTLWSVVGGSQQNTYATYTEYTANPAAITTPVSGSTLTGTSVTFNWSANAATAPYYLWVGTSAGGNDLVNDQITSGTTDTASIPATGSPVYVTLWSTVNGSLKSTSATYTSATQNPAAITSPVSGSTLSASATTFTWAANSATAPYYLWIGTTAGGNNLVNDQITSGTSDTVTVPANNGTVYVTLWSTVGGVLKSSSASYTSATTTPAAITAPVSGSALTSSTVTFTWAANSATAPYYLFVGTTPGGNNLNNELISSGTSVTVNVPSVSGTVYVTLWSTVNGVLKSTSATYTGYTASPATISSPAAGSALASTQTFTYDYNQSTDPVYLWIGTTPGGNDLVNQVATGGSTTATLPTDGATVYMTLWSTLNGSLVYQSYVYTDPTTVSTSVSAGHAKSNAVRSQVKR